MTVTGMGFLSLMTHVWITYCLWFYIPIFGQGGSMWEFFFRYSDGFLSGTSAKPNVLWLYLFLFSSVCSSLVTNGDFTLKQTQYLNTTVATFSLTAREMKPFVWIEKYIPHSLHIYQTLSYNTYFNLIHLQFT